jgi:ribosomal-protein-serine acetyltransferase
MFQIQIEPDLFLELLHPRHNQKIFNLVDQNRVYLREWLPWVDSTKGVEDTNKFIFMTMQQYADDLGFQTCIMSQDRIAGVIGYHAINKAHHLGSIGYWLGKEFWGQGLMTKAAHRVVAEGFKNLALNRIEIRCATGNKRSRSVAERLGFKLEGVLRQPEWLYDHFVDHAVYAMLQEEYV